MILGGFSIFKREVANLSNLFSYVLFFYLFII